LRVVSGEIEAKLAKGEIAPVYVLASGEPLLLDRALVAIRSAAVPPASRAFNHDIVEGRGASAQRILNAAQTLPMMGKLRLVEVRSAHELAAGELAALASYLDEPSPTTVLLLAFAKIDKRVKFFGAAKKRGYLHELAVPRNLERWVEDEAKRRQVAMEPRARARLVDAVGGDLARLALSLDQLALYAGDRPVEADDVEDLIADTRERTVFELIDAIGGQDAPAALAAVAALFEQRQSPIGVVVMLGRQLRQLSLCHEAMASRAPKAEAARRVGVPPFILDKLYAQARRLSPQAVARGIVRVSETDRALKGQSTAMKTLGRELGERVAIERLVTSLIAAQR
jgi:DNA polymerase III subunit delta